MAITIYKSTDASAPVLTGQVGSLTALLLACLVNGYGAKPSVGWTNPLSGTNQRIFRPASGVQHYFGIDDSGVVPTAAAKEAQLTGWETAAAWATNASPGTNTGPFPTSAQFSGGVIIRKSATADATARPWTVIADARTCYVFVQTGDAANVYLAAAFGEFYSLLTTTDAYRSIVIGRSTQNSVSAASTVEMLGALGNASTTPLAGHYVPRAYTGIGTSQAARKWGDTSRAGSTAVYFMGSTGLTLPEPVTGAIHVAPIHISEVNADVRGRMRGLFHSCHNTSQGAPNGIPDGGTVIGSGAYTGRTFYVVTSTNAASYFFDMTGPWETN